MDITQNPLCNNIAKLGLPNHVTQTQNQQIFIVHLIFFQTTLGLISWKSKGTPPMRPPPPGLTPVGRQRGPGQLRTVPWRPSTGVSEEDKSDDDEDKLLEI